MRPDKIGHEKVFRQSWDAAEKVMKILKNNESYIKSTNSSIQARTPIICAEMQGGKTNCIAAVIYDVLEDCKKNNKTYQIIILSALSCLDLQKQTKERLTEYASPDGKDRLGMCLDILAREGKLNRINGNEGILVLNRSQKLRKLSSILTKDVDIRLWIIDEIHQGNGQFGVIASMLRSFGIMMNEQIRNWDQGNTINHVVGVSATAFAHAVLACDQSKEGIDLDDKSLFTNVIIPTGEDYNSMQYMLDNERLKQTEPLVDQKTELLTLFGRTILQQYYQKYTIIRTTGKKYDILLSRIKECDLAYKAFDSKEQNIKDLNNILDRETKEHTVVLIRGAMRAGITLSNTKHIGCWIEQDSKGPDSVAQSGVGRACGYGKKGDSYPIYCNLAAAKEVAEYYKTGMVIPKGIQNKKTVLAKRSRYTLSDPMPIDFAIQLLKTKGSLERKVTRSSTHNVRSLPEMYYNGSLKHSSTVELACFDGPNKNYPGHWESFIEKHPELEGMAVFIRDSPSVINMQVDGNEQQRKNSALKKNDDSHYDA